MVNKKEVHVRCHLSIQIELGLVFTKVGYKSFRLKLSP